MWPSPATLVLVAAGLLLLPQLVRALGLRRGLAACGGLILALAGGWLLLEWPYHVERSDHGPQAEISVSSDTCFKCHEGHHASWHRTFHRSMTREATPETVKGDFDNAVYTYQGVTTRLTRADGRFFMETAPPSKPGVGPPTRQRTFEVVRLVGSHWFQECLAKDDTGAYWRLPVSYHIVEKRWIHTNGAFLAPDTDVFWSKSTVWNESCVFCHNTKISKEPLRPGPGYQTRVTELGIGCEACHGPGGEHVRKNQNPARRFAVRADVADPTIINPRRLPPERADAICAHCHGAIVPRPEAWDLAHVTDPFNAGEDLGRYYSYFWSEAEQARLHGRRPTANPSAGATLEDGRFWGDGTPLTTAVEYQGMALSACYEKGHGNLKCISCHQAHPAEPNFLLAPGMQTNQACYQCHPSYEKDVEAHTHHPAGSPGGLCINCHMAYQTYSLLTTHRSHRIERLHVRDSVGTGKPHACNLCHLDKSLGWTQDRLVSWYGVRPETLPEDERTVSHALLHLCKSDARSRAVVAGAFAAPAARQASGDDWAGEFLPLLLERERFPAVRYLAVRGLRAAYGWRNEDYDYLEVPARRQAQLDALRARWEARPGPAPGRYPYLPLRADGRADRAALEPLLLKRNDPDVYIHE